MITYNNITKHYSLDCYDALNIRIALRETVDLWKKQGYRSLADELLEIVDRLSQDDRDLIEDASND